jgi:serine/threonine-protein kinase
MDSITVTPQGFVAFTISRDGTMYTRTGATISSSSTFELVWIDRTGRESAIDSSFSFRLTSFGANAGWALSPSGDRVAIGLNTDAGDNVWVKHLPRGPVSRITFDSSPAFRPRWWRDGKTVVYTSRRGANAMLYKHAADGTGTDELVYAMKTNPGIYEGAWSPDGKTLALRAGGTVSVVGGRDIMIVQPGVDSAPRKLIASDQFDESGIALSPDGKWIAHESNETGRTEVYIRPFPNADAGKWQVSTEGGRAPLWSRNGRELFFVDGTRTMVSAPVTFGTGAQIGLRTKLFKLRDEIYLANQENYTPFDIAPDGRFLMARTMRTTAAKISPIVVTGNWFTELRTRLAQP